MQDKSSHNVNNLLTRLKRVLKINTDASLAEFLGVSPQAISTWKSRNSIDYELIFAKCVGVDLNWLVRGGTTPQVTPQETPQVSDAKTLYEQPQTIMHEECVMCKEKNKIIDALTKTVSAQEQTIDLLNTQIQDLKENRFKKTAG
jgi:hypothetical protein